MAEEYDPADPPTFSAVDEHETYDPAEYAAYEQHDAADGDDDDEYDPPNYDSGDSTEQRPDSAVPELAQAAPPTQPDPPMNLPAKPQQKMAGFIVEESDDEQDAGAPLAPSQLNGSASAQPDLGAIAHDEARDVSISSVPQDTAAASTSLNGSTAVHVPASTSNVSDPSLQPSASTAQGKVISPVASASASASIAPTPQPPATAVAAAPAEQPPKINGTELQQLPLPARLPHDKVGQLEERITDDPKGDTKAWLSLVDHYYEKGQYDNARKIYQRFIETFPTAVCCLPAFCLESQRNMTSTHHYPNTNNPSFY